MPSFKIKNWELDVNKNKSSVNITAQNLSNNLHYTKKLTNKDIAEGKFRLMDDIDDLYASLTEGANPWQESVKLNMSDDGHLTITQKVLQADREKIFNSDITLEKESKTVFASKNHKSLEDKVGELENEIKRMKFRDENELEEIKNTIGEQAVQIINLRKNLNINNRIDEEEASRIKSLEKELENLKRRFEESENKRITSNFSFDPNEHFYVSNNGKRAVSKTIEYHSIYSSSPLIKGVTYSFKIIGDDFINLELIPEQTPLVDHAYAQARSFGFDSEGSITGGKYTIPAYKNGDIVSFCLLEDGKTICSLNNQVVYTGEVPCNISNYKLYLYTGQKANIGVELM